MKLFKKIVLITGTSAPNGLGINLVKRALEQSYTVIATTTQPNRNTFDLYKDNQNFNLIEMHIDDIKSVKKAFLDIKKITPKIDILINNAVTRSENTNCTLGNINEDLLLPAFNTNILGTLRVIQQALSFLPETCTICQISSGYGRIDMMTDTKWLDYSISKTGIDMLSKFVSNSLPNANVFSVDPGWMRTNELDTDAPNDPYEIARIVLRMCLEKQNIITKAWS